jgi:guanylate kinase
LEELENRLRGRGGNSEEDINRRLAIAEKEISQKILFDYSVISSTREADLEAMKTVIQTARDSLNKK